MVVDGGCGWIEKNGFEVGACTWQVAGGRRGGQGTLPGAVVVKVGPESLVGCLPQTMSGQVERDGQVFVVLYGCFEPLFAVFGELVVGQKWNGEWNVRLGWTEVAVLERLVDDV